MGKPLSVGQPFSAHKDSVEPRKDNLRDSLHQDEICGDLPQLSSAAHDPVGDSDCGGWYVAAMTSARRKEGDDA
jgi:hypothetical protein